MRDTRKLRVTVAQATGHGVHALLPSEPAVCVLEIGGAQRKETGIGRPLKAGSSGCQWGESLDFEYEGGTPRTLHVEVHGRLAHGAEDLVGAGDLDLHEVMELGTRQMVAVPLTKGGRQLGALELCIQHQAMPDRE